MTLGLSGHGRRIVLFGMIGVLNTAIDFCVFAVAYYLFGAPVLIAHVSAFLVAATNSYIFNQKFTFRRSREERNVPEFLRFLTVTGTGLLVSSIVVVVLSDHIHVLAAKLAAILCTLLIGYIGSSVWVFRRSPPYASGDRDG